MGIHMFGGLIKTKLMDHQKNNLMFHLRQDRTADFSEMGTGKSLTALAKIAHLVAKGLLKKTLIICPMSAISSWEIEIKKHSNLSLVAFRGQLFEKGELMNMYPNEDIYLISYDSIPGRKRTRNILLSALLAFEFDMIICDEVPFIKNYETLRFRSVLQLCDAAKYVLFLTGTPITNKPDTIFNIYRALDKGATFGVDYYAARAKYFRQVSLGFPVWKVREERKDELIHKMYLRAIRVRKDECLTLPPKIFSPKYCVLSKQQRSIYDPVAEELLKKFKIGDHKFKISTTLVKLSKLSQICSGFMYDNLGKPLYIKDNSKVELLEDILQEIGDEKTIIFTRWREDTTIVGNALKHLKISYETLTGDTKDRKTIIENFQEGKVQALVSNIRVGGYAITLTSSSYAIYFSMNFALDDWLQSQDRIHRKGQTKTCVYVPLLCKDAIDNYIYKMVLKNVDLATSIVDPIKEVEATIGSSLQ